MYDGLEVVVGVYEGGNVEAGLFEHFPDGTVRGVLLLVDLPLGKSPRRLGEVALHEQDVGQALRKQYGAIGRHSLLVLAPFGDYRWQLIVMRLKCWYVL